MRRKKQAHFPGDRVTSRAKPASSPELTGSSVNKGKCAAHISPSRERGYRHEGDSSAGWPQRWEVRGLICNT